MTRARSAAVCSGVFGDQKYRNALQPTVGTPAAARPAATLLSRSAHPPSPLNTTAITSPVDGVGVFTSITERPALAGIGEAGLSAVCAAIVRARCAWSRGRANV